MYAPPDSLKSLGSESGGSFSSNSFHSPLLSGCDDPARCDQRFLYALRTAQCD